jgi:hypothetical protein
MLPIPIAVDKHGSAQQPRDHLQFQQGDAARRHDRLFLRHRLMAGSALSLSIPGSTAIVGLRWLNVRWRGEDGSGPIADGDVPRGGARYEPEFTPELGSGAFPSGPRE